MKKYAIYLVTAMVVLMTAGCAEDLNKDLFKYDVNYLAVSGIKLNKSELTLSWNSRETLTATVSPERADNREFTWSSSNESVASVSLLGEVVANAVGEATITVTTADGGKTDECKVTVNPYVLLSETELTLLVGDKVTLEASVQPASYAQDLVWSLNGDDADKFISVSSTGEVTALANGSANVRATIPGTSLRGTCAVRVGNVPVEKVELDAQLFDIEVGVSVILTATVSPADAWNPDVEWKVKGNFLVLTPDTDNPYVVTITRIAEGDAAVTVVTDDGGYEATCQFKTDPVFFFTGGLDAKIWTWDNLQWGPLDRATDWWTVDFDVADDLLTNTYNSKDGKGAFMTFSYTGLKMVKENIDGDEEEGTFSVDMTKTKNIVQDNVPWSIGQLTTKDVTILWGRHLDHEKINDADKTPKDGNYPNGEEDVKEVFVFDIITLTDDEMVLAVPGDSPDKTPDMNSWSGAWYWYFKPVEE